ncbi:MAG TPA: hypothetical protein VN765_16885 [Candidatus Acidoferrum sp.]|nr:hypothetical protein [Candidatus Acidoferrum sp.]
MSQHKYGCPYCGQHIEFTDAHCGVRVPCPKCQHPILLPALMGGEITSSLRLAQPIGSPAAGFHFTVAGMRLAFREFKHWRIVGVCLVPFLLVAAALVAASVSARHQAPRPAAPAEAAVDPRALDTLTDLTRAKQLVQDQLAAVNRAFAACQAAERKQAELHDPQLRSASPATLQTADEAVLRARQAKVNARKEFDKAFALYLKLGGTIDYRLQLP